MKCKKIVEYAVINDFDDYGYEVESRGVLALSDNVNALIGDGWQPIGGICFSKTDGDSLDDEFFSQAMIRVCGVNNCKSAHNCVAAHK